MKKIFFFSILFLLVAHIYSCAGYKPIFSTSDLKFIVEEHTIEGDKNLGNIIYSKLYNLSKAYWDPLLLSA